MTRRWRGEFLAFTDMQCPDRHTDQRNDAKEKAASDNSLQAAKLKRERQLIADRHYPSPQVARKLAQILADRYLKGQL